MLLSRRAFSVCLLVWNVAYPAIMRNCPLGDARNCQDPEREACSGAKQVFSRFQMECRNTKCLGRYLLVMASFSGVVSPVELITGMLLNPADEMLKLSTNGKVLSSVWRRMRILPHFFFPQ